MSDETHRPLSRRHLIRTIIGITTIILMMVGNSFILSLLAGKFLPVERWPFHRSLYFPALFFITFLLMILESRILFLFRPRHVDIFSQLIDAFRKISRGDYDIHLTDRDEHGHFSRLTGSLNEMADALRETERMRQQFISDMSHEIQSPLTSIQGFARILRDEELDEGKRKAYLAIIEDESRRLSRLSEELLEMTKLEASDLTLEPSEYSLDRQIRDVILNYEPLWREKNLEMEVDLEEGMIIADRDLMVRVWNNLLHNAIKFTPAGKKVSIRLQADPAYVTISDEGIGVEEEDLPRIFDRFHKADKSRHRGDHTSGSGLGLSIVKKIVTLHGGDVTAHSSGPGRGTVITVRMPADRH